MKHLIIIATVLVSGFLTAQTNYEKGMQKAFELWGKNKPTEASNMFERISGAEPDNWLPAYYAAQINIINSFGLRDEEKLSAQLKKAQNLINDATAISKNNPEHPILKQQWKGFVHKTFPNGEKWKWLMEHYNEFDKPDNLKDQLQWLEKVGFDTVDVKVYEKYWTHFRAIKN